MSPLVPMLVWMYGLPLISMLSCPISFSVAKTFSPPTETRPTLTRRLTVPELPTATTLIGTVVL